LREDFNMPGSPIRMTLRSQAEKNPFKNKKKPSHSRLNKHLK
jgi:GTP-binding protein